MAGYRFLIDNDSVRTAALFPKDRVLSLSAVGLPQDASDDEVVRKAWEKRAIVVTANGDDFIRAIERFQKKQMRKECRELSGLIVVPNELEN